MLPPKPNKNVQIGPLGKACQILFYMVGTRPVMLLLLLCIRNLSQENVKYQCISTTEKYTQVNHNTALIETKLKDIIQCSRLLKRDSLKRNLSVLCVGDCFRTSKYRQITFCPNEPGRVRSGWCIHRSWEAGTGGSGQDCLGYMRCYLKVVSPQRSQVKFCAFTEFFFSVQSVTSLCSGTVTLNIHCTPHVQQNTTGNKSQANHFLNFLIISLYLPESQSYVQLHEQK